MIIVIDGYNLLKTLYGVSTVTERQKKGYLEQLKRYAVKRKHRIVVIFDGGYYDYPLLEKQGKISIIYSGTRQNADQVIQVYLSDNKDKDILLVTNDIELINYAKKLAIISIDVLLFDEYVTNALEKPDAPRPKISGPISQWNTSDEGLDRLMIEATDVLMEKNEESPLLQARHKVQTISKRGKKLQSKLKKL